MSNAFESELSKSFGQLSWWHHKLSVTVGIAAKFVGKVPFDYVAITDALPIAIEAKSSRVRGSFPFDRVKEHQVSGLSDFCSHGWPAYVLINFRKPKNKAYAISIEDWLWYMATLERKSIPADEFEKSSKFIEIPRVKVNGLLSWDLRVLEDHIKQWRIKWQNDLSLDGGYTQLNSSRPKVRRSPPEASSYRTPRKKKNGRSGQK